MNSNAIVNDDWSNPDSKRLYSEHWPNEPSVFQQYQDGNQCGGCSFFAKFDMDWGLCCHAKSRHNLETIFEHFTCAAYVGEGWGPHSFTEDTEWHCRCAGEPLPQGDV